MNKFAVFFILWITTVLTLTGFYTQKLSTVQQESFKEGFKQGNHSGYVTGFHDGNKTGFKQGNSSGYNTGYTHGYNSHPLTPEYDKNEVVLFNGTIQKNGYTFIFKNNYKMYGAAYTHNNTVIIENGYTAESTEDTCTHEVLHNLFPVYRHTDPLPDDINSDPIYFLDSKTVLEVCRSTVSTALEKQK